MRQYRSAKALFLSLPDNRRGTVQGRLLAVFKRIKGDDARTLLDDEEKRLHGAP